MNYENMTPEESKAFCEHVTGLLTSGDDSSIKQAEMTMTEYIRPTNREMDFCHRFLTPTPFDPAEQVYSDQHDHVEILVEIEPSSPGAMVVDIGYQPNTFYPYGRRAKLRMQQQQTERVVKDITELANYRYRLRQALTDLQSLQLATFRDARLLNACRTLYNTAGVPLVYSGAPNNVDYGANLDYATWLRFMDITMGHPNKLVTASVLVNQLTLKYIKLMIAHEFQGSDLAADMWRSGQGEITLPDGTKLVATIKNLVAENEYLGFAAENRLGRYVQYKAPTMIVKNEGTNISFYQWESYGMLIVNPTGVSRGLCNNS